ncbi:MAG TPA: pectinesterase family protein [Longimicrobium sp.]|nr:pectinesterase family protein [Longimicrobium sp.]
MKPLRTLPVLPALLLAAFASADPPVSLYLAGDSTIAQKLVTRRPETGWGEMLQQYFDIDRVRVQNHARNGRSTRTFLSEGRWRAIVDALRPGDYVFIQFGHNDGSADKMDRYTPPADYRANLARFVAEVRAKQANPVLMTPVMRRRFDENGVFYDAHGEYPDIVRSVAAELRVPLIDMHRSSERVLREYGAERSRRLFLHLAPGENANYPQGLEDNTHFSPAGAEVMAGLAVEGIRQSVPALAAHLAQPGPVQRPAAIVDASHGGAGGDRIDGVPAYRTISAAVSAAPAEGTEPYVIRVRGGRYREKLSIDKPNVHLVGDGRDATLLTYDVAAGHRGPGGAPYGTRGSWTLRIAAPGFRLEGMTVENAFDYMANAARPDSDSAKLRGTQAVAVMLDEGSDRAVFRDCRLSGHQDTLFPNAGRSYFHRCEILGSVDFIFGAGRAVFEECDIVSRDRGSATNNGYVTAPSTPIAQPYGFVFVRSRLRKETPEMAPGSVTLGRPWHPSGRPDAIGSAVFIDTWMDDHVGATGWSPMTSTNAAGERVEHQPRDARFFEYGTTGPGAVPSPSRRVLTAEQAAEYTIVRVLDGWDPRP